MIAILNYGLGNIAAFENVYRRLNLPVLLASNASDLTTATRVIVPGVGSFDDAIMRLNRSGMRPALEECVLGRKIPVLGVCVGMQMLASGSDEGHRAGLGWVKGRVKMLSSVPPGGTRVPHMGWNGVKTVTSDSLFEGLETDARFYFLHSYYFDVESRNEVIAVAEYGREFACAVRSGNVFGVQFHPEKSHGWGQKFLENFARIEP